jgi:hypothetical protein
LRLLTATMREAGVGKAAGVLIAWAAFGAIGCTKKDDPTPAELAGDTPAVSATEPPSTEQVLNPIEDYGTVARAEEGSVAVGLTAPDIEVGDPGSDADLVVLRFAPGLGAPDCILGASLELHIPTDATTAPLVVYPGDPAVLTDVAEDVPLGATHKILANRPRGDVTIEGQVGRADLTDLVRTWAAGGPFNSRWPDPAPDTPLTLVLQQEENSVGALGTFHLQMTESGPPTAPTLHLKHTC